MGGSGVSVYTLLQGAVVFWGVRGVGKMKKHVRLARVIGLQPIAQPRIPAGYSVTGNNRETKSNSEAGYALVRCRPGLLRRPGSRVVLASAVRHTHMPHTHTCLSYLAQPAVDSCAAATPQLVPIDA